jgi:perosamine synthetase
VSGKRIPVAGPWITDKEVAYVAEAARTAWYEHAGDFNQRFETAFAKYLGVKHAITLPSCTSALHLSLLTFKVGPGDEVVVPDITWIATAAPISYVGASAVFADIDPRSWCLSAESFESVITPRTKAVIPVDLYGNMPDMSAITSVAARHGIAVIEDAAEAIGSQYKGALAGSFGDTGVFSFHGSKTLTTGEGGMLVTDSKEIADRVLVLRDHGRSPGDRMFLNAEVAYKYKMSALQAALGLAQLERIEALLARKREIYSWYVEELADVHELELNQKVQDVESTYWMVTAVMEPTMGRKDSVMQWLTERGIDSRPFFSPLSSLKAYANCREAELARRRNTVSYRISPYAINLPSALNLTREEVNEVCSALRSLHLKSMRTRSN